MINAFFNKLYLPFFYRNWLYNPLKIFRFLEKSQYWSREEIERYQIEHLNRLIELSKSSSHFYKQHLLNYSCLKESVNELLAYPYLKKSEIREYGDKLFINQIIL